MANFFFNLGSWASNWTHKGVTWVVDHTGINPGVLAASGVAANFLPLDGLGRLVATGVLYKGVSLYRNGIFSPTERYQSPEMQKPFSGCPRKRKQGGNDESPQNSDDSSINKSDSNGLFHKKIRVVPAPSSISTMQPSESQAPEASSHETQEGGHPQYNYQENQNSSFDLSDPHSSSCSGNDSSLAFEEKQPQQDLSREDGSESEVDSEGKQRLKELEDLEVDFTTYCQQFDIDSLQEPVSNNNLDRANQDFEQVIKEVENFLLAIESDCLKFKLDALQEEVNKKASEQQGLSDSLDRARQELEKLEAAKNAMLQAQEAKNKELLETQQALEHQKASLEGELHTTQAQLASQIASVKSATQALVNLKKEHDIKKALIAKLTEQAEALQTEGAKNSVEQKGLAEALVKAKQELQALEINKQAACQAQEDKNKELLEAQEAVEASRAKLQVFQVESSQKGNELLHFNQELEALDNQLNHKSLEVEAAAQALKEQQEALQAAKNQYENLQENLQTLEKHVKVEAQKSEALKKQNEELGLSLEAKNVALNQVTQALAYLGGIYENLQQQAADLAGKLQADSSGAVNPFKGIPRTSLAHTFYQLPQNNLLTARFRPTTLPHGSSAQTRPIVNAAYPIGPLNKISQGLLPFLKRLPK